MALIAVLAHAHFPIREPFVGGLEMHTSMLVRELVRLGHRVVLYAKQGSVVPGADVRPIVPATFDFGLHGIEPLHHGYQTAMADIESRDVDYIINNTLNSVPLSSDTAAPMLTVFHTPSFWEIARAARLAAHKPRRAFLAVSEVTARDWRHLVPQVKVVPNGIRLEQWPVSYRHDGELRWSARITPEKGLHLAIDAARLNGRALRIAGPVSDAEYFEDVIKPMLSAEITYEGHFSHADLPAFLGSGEVALASPMWDEPFGLSVVEALACGTPVAALPRGAMPELLPRHVGALALDRTAAALSNAIDRAATLHRGHCADHARAHYGVDTMVIRYLAALQRIAVPLSLSAAPDIEAAWAG